MKNWQFYWIMAGLTAIRYEINHSVVTLIVGGLFLLLAAFESTKEEKK